MALASGTRLGPYEILGSIGAGGMGEVYRARDPRLSRDVAIKVLPDEVARDAERRRRFEKEARSASSLNHPSIVTIHDIGAEGDVLYVVFELLEGETLRARLAAGPLPASKAIEWAIQIARGLAAAHEKGIVHRDLKPENLWVTPDGRVKILDFGLARSVAPTMKSGTGALTESRQTEPGVVLGTIGYMSPEQARGLDAGPGSDIFSFGAILYEMLSGRRAFSGPSTADILISILRDEPPGLDTPAPSLPTSGVRILRRCLEKDPAQRFQAARDLAFALEALALPGPVPAGKPGDGRRAIAVLPFKSLSRNPEEAHLGVGLADSIITELAVVRSLLVRPTAAILRYRDHPVDPRDAGHELGVDAVVDGSFQSAGSRLRVTVQLVETADGKPLWGTKIDTSLDDIFAMQDEVSRRIVEALQLQLTPADEKRLAAAAAPAASPAYELYLKGRFHLFSETRLPEINAAVEAFEKALELDPNSVLAMVGLADAWTRLAFSFDPDGGWYDRAEALCAKALALAPNLPELHYLRGRMAWNPRRGFDHPGALRELAAAIAGRPNLGEAYHWTAQVLNHIGLLDESAAAFEQALAIYPDDLATLHMGLVRWLQGRYAEGRDVTEMVLARASSPWTCYQLANCQLRLGQIADTEKTLARAAREFPGDVLFLGLQGVMAARSGDVARARDLGDAVVRNRRSFGHYHHALYDRGCIHALLGETEAAVEDLRQAAATGFPCLPFFEIDPLLESIRGTSPWEKLHGEMRAVHEDYRRLYASLRSQVIEASGSSG